MNIILLCLMLSVGMLWAFDTLVIHSQEFRPVEAALSGVIIGFALTNLLFALTGI